MNRRTLSCIAVLASAPLLAQGVRLTRVPERVVLPALPGQNLIVEVEVGGDVEDVWLATGDANGDRVTLRKTGAETFQVNLADDGVAKLLPADRDFGDLFVFARVAGATRKSAAISWARVVARDAVQLVAVRDDRSRLFASREHMQWCDPYRVARLEVLGAGMPQAKAVVVAGDTTIPMARGPGATTFSLTLNDGMRASLAQQQEFGVEVTHGERSWWLPFRAVPATLPEEGRSFVVRQRRRADVPGSHGWLRVSLDDITGGQVLLSMRDANGEVVVAERSIGEREHVAFSLAGGDYVLVVDRLVNRLVGDDHAELRVVAKQAFEPDVISELIVHVGAQRDVRFVRKHVEYSPMQAVQFLRVRRGLHRGDEVLTPEGFVELASKSSTDGSPYHIKLADGELVDAKAWFIEQLAVVRDRVGKGATK